MNPSDLPSWAINIRRILLPVAACAAWWFVFRYTTTWPWWRNAIGRSMAAMAVSLGSLLTYFGVVGVWPNFPGHQWVRFGLFVALTVVLVEQVYMFERLRLLIPREERADPERSAGE
jgi:hypothetical protein